MTKDNKSREQEPVFQGYVINEDGEEVPITDDMVEESMAEVKLKSIGTHTGYTKAITDDMLPAEGKNK